MRAEMERVLASPHFCNSKRYPALLRYVVENTIEGRSELLKERTLGVQVFDRPPLYDTNADTVVRYTAGEVRKRLALYYHETEDRPKIQISLPAGSYIPEFVNHVGDDSPGGHSRAAPHPQIASETGSLRDALIEASGEGAADPASASVPEPLQLVPRVLPVFVRRRFGLAGALALVVLAGLVLGGWRYRTVHGATALDDFWAPVIRDQKTVMLCSGGVVFKQGNFSGVTTAGKDIEYPFVSSQIAISISRLSSLLQSKGSAANLQFSASTPISTLREQPVILLGGYNNQWTLRLLDQLPLHFAPETNASIVGVGDAREHWARDTSEPYSSADDYALIARFRNTTTDSWIVVLAGLGRNGTEAATQFVTSPHYMDLLKNRVGANFANRNVEAVLKVDVIDGKTGAPSLIAVRAW